MDKHFYFLFYMGRGTEVDWPVCQVPSLSIHDPNVLFLFLDMFEMLDCTYAYIVFSQPILALHMYYRPASVLRIGRFKMCWKFSRIKNSCVIDLKDNLKITESNYLWIFLFSIFPLWYSIFFIFFCSDCAANSPCTACTRPTALDQVSRDP